MFSKVMRSWTIDISIEMLNGVQFTVLLLWSNFIF